MVNIHDTIVYYYFSINRILEPLFYGHYPQTMKEIVGNRLPNFTKEERKLVKGSTDFIGINYYNSHYAKHEPNRTKIDNVDNYDALATQEGNFLPKLHSN